MIRKFLLKFEIQHGTFRIFVETVLSSRMKIILNESKEEEKFTIKSLFAFTMFWKSK